MQFMKFRLKARKVLALLAGLYVATITLLPGHAEASVVKRVGRIKTEVSKKADVSSTKPGKDKRVAQLWGNAWANWGNWANWNNWNNWNNWTKFSNWNDFSNW